jgi:hypothetical protein
MPNISIFRMRYDSPPIRNVAGNSTLPCFKLQQVPFELSWSTLPYFSTFVHILVLAKRHSRINHVIPCRSSWIFFIQWFILLKCTEADGVGLIRTVQVTKFFVLEPSSYTTRPRNFRSSAPNTAVWGHLQLLRIEAALWNKSPWVGQTRSQSSLVIHHFEPLKP